MKKRKPIILVFVVLILVMVFIFIISLNYPKEEITNFEECVAAGFAVGESYPRQCWTEKKHFVEEITWKNDGVVLMQNSETGEFACFGCSTGSNVALCIDPIPTMKLVNETIDMYCNQEFEIVGNEKDFCSNDSRNVDACITLYDPVCGWSDPDKIKCIKFPCASTYSNSCNACKNPDVLYFKKGECPTG